MISRTPSTRLSALRANLVEARHHWRAGRGYGYPACCVAVFSLDAALGLPTGQARAQQIEDFADEWPYVYCGIFHEGDSPLPLRVRLRRILATQWSMLRPFPAARTTRAQFGFGLLSRRSELESVSSEFERWRAHTETDASWVDDGGLDPELEWR